MTTAKKLPNGHWRVNLFIGKDPNGKRKIQKLTLHEAISRCIESKRNI